MTDDEKAFRLTALTVMFEGHGIEAPPERLRRLGNLTKFVPADVLRQAIDRAEITNVSGFPPTAGQIVAAALVLAPGKLNPGQGRSLPQWYLHAISDTKRREQPREIGTRGQVADFQLAAAGDDGDG
jgi:hypothetical protein